jgi:hypothetical protein
MLAGNAAFAVDRSPRNKKIEAGLQSAAAVAHACQGDAGGMAEYDGWTVESFRSYLAVRQQVTAGSSVGRAHVSGNGRNSPRLQPYLWPWQN